MPSIYQKAMGAEFERLHPRIRERFGFSSADGIACIGRGMMERIWYARAAALPLALGATRHLMFPEGGSEIPFTVHNYAYTDKQGRETVSWVRKFRFPRRIRTFDASMIYSPQRERIVDYLGNRQHLAVDLQLSSDPRGGIRIRSGEQRFYEGPLQFRWPRIGTGEAEVCEWYDDDARCFRIEVTVRNPLLGPVFHYKGRFQAEYIPASGRPIPLDILPFREEYRE
ncbi:DUF4166 domain-containing protein [Paenibacillus sp. 1P07SE]|uniref:DUF4166 domain-containing protein n=1 Tax=Paenibacillus sp. 1P07SE TaxID=3132209 RepID=UPI0039A45540